MKELIILFDDNEKDLLIENEITTILNEKAIRGLENNYLNKLVEEVSLIGIDYEKNKLRKLLNNFPILKSKKINITMKLSDYDKIIELKEQFNDCNISIKLEANEKDISVDQAIKTISKLREISSSVKEHNMSPLETIMYVYDLVKNHEYDKDDDIILSYKTRDLSEVLFKDKMVCVGFVNTFNAILSFLGIRCKSSQAPNHVRSCIYVKDEKYNVDGVYYFDPTWDCKKSKDEKDYLFRYNNFAKTSNYFYEIENSLSYLDAANSFIDYYFNGMKDKNDFLPNKLRLLIALSKAELGNEFQSINSEINCFFNDDETNFYDTILREEIYFCELFGKDESLIDIDQMKKENDMKKNLLIIQNLFDRRTEKFREKWNKEIPGETMLELLKNVREIENKIGIAEPLCALEATSIALLSNWNFENKEIKEKIYNNPTNKCHLIGNYCYELDIPFNFHFKSTKDQLIDAIYGEPNYQKFIDNYKRTIDNFEKGVYTPYSLVALYFFYKSQKITEIEPESEKIILDRLDKIIKGSIKQKQDNSIISDKHEYHI